jgi:hypothetical protein
MKKRPVRWGRPFHWKHRATALSDTKEEVSLSVSGRKRLGRG